MARFRALPSGHMPEQLPKTVAPRQAEKQAMQYLTANLQAMGRRECQEDSFAFANALSPDAIREKGLMAVVADGMGGLRGGKIASETATSALISAFKAFDPTGDLARQLDDAVFDANDQVFAKLNGVGGSTVVAGVILDEKLFFSSVGDSYIFLLRDHRLFRLNRSHNVFSRDNLDAIFDGVLDPHAAFENPEKEAITQFLGMPELEETDSLIRPLPLMPGDVLMFCSDGIGGTLSVPCIENCLKYARPVDMCSALEEEINKINLRYQDNYTALIVQCRN